MKHLACVTAIFLSALIPLKGQEQDKSLTRIMLQGIVMDSETLIPLPNSQIFVNRRFTSLSSDQGSFGVYVNIRDTLMVSRLGYQPATLIINDTLVLKPFVAGIFLSTDTIEIAEVVIIPRLASLRSEIMNPRMNISPEIQNARTNVAVSAYAGRTTTGKLGDPLANYHMIKEQQKVNAYERGQIPSDRIAAISPLMLLPAAYLLMKGLPEKPDSFRPAISDYELEKIRKTFMQRK